MTVLSGTRAIYVALFLTLVAALALGVWRYSYVRALEQIETQAQADLTLASDRLVSELQRFRLAAVLLSDHPVLKALHNGGDVDAANALLLESVDKTAALTAYYAQTDGQVLASAHGVTLDRIDSSGAFQRALHGALGAEASESMLGDRRSFSYAAPSFGPQGTVIGVLVMVIDINNLEQEWLGVRPAVWFMANGAEVFVSSRSEMLFWRQEEGGFALPDGSYAPVTKSQVNEIDVWRQRLSPYVPEQAVHVVRELPVIGMRAEALLDAGPARLLAVLQTAAVGMLCLVFGSILFVTMERRRTLALANVVLEERVQERTQKLEVTNTQLRREVAERQEAETALRRAQRDLVQAGKLSALGQMSAGISHELNQPLMAIQQYADNGKAFLERGQAEKAEENLGRIASMSARAARIIRNLRAFARNESEPMSRIDLVDVLSSAVELTQTRMTEETVTLVWERPADPIWVRAGEVRLSQVFVNLINNAMDAMAGTEAKLLRIAVETDDVARVRLWDSGPGITDPDKIFEPFYSTKEVGDGEGMGLGLSISYGLVQSFGGRIRGANAAEGGAVFTVELDIWSEALG